MTPRPFQHKPPASVSTPAYRSRQQQPWYGEPYSQGRMFRLHQHRRSLRTEAVCRLARHHTGWELRLKVEGSPLRSHVCATQLEVLSVGEIWKAALIEAGWR